MQPAAQDIPLRRVKRHREMMDKFRSDNEVLKQDLARETREARRTGNLSGSDEIMRLHRQVDMFAGRIQNERKKISELDARIEDTRSRIIEQRKKIGGANAAKENDDRIGREICKLENRLDKALVKFNESVGRNKQLRTRIDNLRRERVVFDGIYKKLERELHEKKKEMQAIIRDSTNAYDARGRAQSEVQQLKAQAEADRHEFQKDWTELGRLIEKDRALRDERRAEAVHAAEREAAMGSDIAEREEAATSEIRPSDDEWDAGKDRLDPSLRPTDTAVASYEGAFRKIQEAVGSSDVEEVVQKFLDAEEKNFSLFNFVNEQNSEIERLEVMIGDTKAEIERFKGQGRSSDRERRKNLRTLDDRLRRTEAKAKSCEAAYERATRTITKLKQGIQSIFSRIGCASTSVEETLGNQGVTESNMMQYLGIIEQRTNEILQMYASSQATTDPGLLAGSAPEVASHTRQEIIVQPPGWDDFDSEDGSGPENEERPLTREELARKTLRAFNRKDRAKYRMRG